MSDKTFLSFAEIWDFCLEKMYNRDVFVASFIRLLNKIGVSKTSKILDASCGSGFPMLDLVDRGYNVVGTDISDDMILRLKVAGKGKKVKVYKKAWSELGLFFKNSKFDFVYCRGNSLIYAATWEKNWINPSRSINEIEIALVNFFKLLKPNGILYLDVTSKAEHSHSVLLGSVKTKYGKIELNRIIKHCRQKHIREWIVKLLFHKTGDRIQYQSYGYLFDKDELDILLKKVGFKKIAFPVIVGEKNYDILLAYK